MVLKFYKKILNQNTEQILSKDCSKGVMIEL